MYKEYLELNNQNGWYAKKANRAKTYIFNMCV